MEALFLLIGEMIAAPLAALSVLIIQGVVAAISFLATLFETALGVSLKLSLPGKGRRQAMTPEEREVRRLRRARRLRIMMRVSLGLGAVFALLMGCVVLLNTVFFEPMLRWGLRKVHQRTGIEVRFSSASGSLFKGEFRLSGVTAVRTNSTVSTFDLQADEFVLDLNVLRIVPFTPRLQEILVKGLEGEFHRISAPDSARPRRSYNVDHLRIESAEIAVHDHTREPSLPFRIKISELDSRPLRSQFAVFDLLFRSNIDGEVEGCPFTVRTERKAESGRKTTWEARDLPVAFVGQYLGGPFKWMNAGTVDVDVRDEWQLSAKDDARIHMEWSFLLKNISVDTSTNSSVAATLVGSAVREYLRRNSDQLDISFGLTITENQFAGTASLGAAGLGNAVRDGLNREIASRTGSTPEKVDETVRAGVERFRNYLDRRRGAPTNTAPPR